jgi:hypothetical protein
MYPIKEVSNAKSPGLFPAYFGGQPQPTTLQTNGKCPHTQAYGTIAGTPVVVVAAAVVVVDVVVVVVIVVCSHSVVVAPICT